MNRVEISGGLVRDPEVRPVGAHDVTLLSLTVAVNGTRYDSTLGTQVVKTTFVTVNVWGLHAEELMRDYALSKGDEVYVLGELDQSELTKPDGTKEKKTRVTGMHVNVLRSRQSTPQTGSNDQNGEPPF